MGITDQDYARRGNPYTPKMPGKRIGLVNIATNADIMAEKKAIEAERARQTDPEVVTLSSYVSTVYERNKLNREASGVEYQMLRSLAQRNNEYDAEKMAAIIAAGGTEVFTGITGVKCRAAESWLGDVLAQNSWGLKPSPIPDLPPVATQVIADRVMNRAQEQFAMAQQGQGQEMSPDEIYDMAAELRESLEDELNEEAIKRSEGMQTKIEDQLAEGGWENAFDDMITNACTLKAGFIKGPILRKKKEMTFPKAAFSGRTTVKVKEVVKHTYESPSPLDMYPSDGAMDCNDGDLVERMWFTRKQLQDMKGLDGFDVNAINLVLNDFGRDGFRTYTSLDSWRSILEERGNSYGDRKGLIEGREFWGSVQGRLLIERGMYTDLDGNLLKPLEEYEVNAIQIGTYIIHVRFNPDPLGNRLYSKTGWATVPGSFWYKGIPELMEDLQEICNAAVRALVNNLSIASGPQVVINDISRIDKAGDIESMYPWKIWQFSNTMKNQNKAIDFFQPKAYSKELFMVYQEFAKLADDYTGIPAYMIGNDKIAGAGRTSSGLAMLMNSASRGIKKVISRIDREILQPVVLRQYQWNMLYGKDESIKGDVNIQPQGALAMILNEQMAQARMDFMNGTNNELDQYIMGLEGRASLLRKVSEPLQMRDDGLVPDRKRIKKMAIQREQEQMALRQAELAQQQQPVAA